MAGRLTTHVLDTMHGKPAAGLRFDLLMLHGDHSHHLLSGLTNEDGRVTLTMPHPERSFRYAQNSRRPDGAGEYSGWYRMFANARRWVG